MKIKVHTISNICLLFLTLIIFCNLNGITKLLLNITAPFSIVMLILSTVILTVNFSNPELRKKINNLIFITSIYLIYLLISTCSLLWDSSLLHEKMSIFELYRSYLSSIIIISAYYFGIQTYFNSKNKLFSTSLLTPFIILVLLFIVFGGEFGLYDNFVGQHRTFGNERSSGLFANPNEAGSFSNYGLVIFLAAFSSSKYRIIYLGLCVLAFMGAVLSFSKAALIMTYLIIMFFIFRSLGWVKLNAKGLNKYLFLTVALIVCGIFYIGINFNGIFQNLTRNQQIRVAGTMAILQGEINDETTSSRASVFKHGFELIQDKPIFGNGIGTFHKFSTAETQHGVHNTFLMLIGEGGFLPLLFFVLFFSYLFYKGLIIRDLEIGFFISGFVIVYLVNVCSTGHNALDDRISNALLGTILAVLNSVKSK